MGFLGEGLGFGGQGLESHYGGPGPSKFKRPYSVFKKREVRMQGRGIRA